MVGNWALGWGPLALAHGPGPWALPPPDRCPDRRPPARGAQGHGPRAQIYVPGGHDVFVFPGGPDVFVFPGGHNVFIFPELTKQLKYVNIF